MRLALGIGKRHFSRFGMFDFVREVQIALGARGRPHLKRPGDLVDIQCRDRNREGALGRSR
jgi:hypothetical protein